MATKRLRSVLSRIPVDLARRYRVRIGQSQPARCMSHRIETMSLQDYDQIIELWQNTEGVGLNESDSREQIAQFLARNRGMSFVIRNAGRIIGAVLCGHDGRRGYMHHLAVARSHRGQGLGRQLVNACLAQLERAGIQKCNIFLYANHAEGEAFWKHNGWSQRPDLVVMQKPLGRSKQTTGC